MYEYCQRIISFSYSLASQLGSASIVEYWIMHKRHSQSLLANGTRVVLELPRSDLLSWAGQITPFRRAFTSSKPGMSIPACTCCHRIEFKTLEKEVAGHGKVYNYYTAPPSFWIYHQRKDLDLLDYCPSDLLKRAVALTPLITYRTIFLIHITDYFALSHFD